MMRRNGKTQRRIIASLMTGVFMLQQTMTLTVVASDISGVTGQNGVYNIDPTKKSGDIGFRQYQNFNVSQGDIANLNFADVNTFVNLVDNQVVVNGIVNSMRNGGFYNGKAVFVSPNGMLVGASGVLNVGSLGVYAPSQSGYARFKNNQTAEGLNTLVNNDVFTGGKITINGKVMTAGDVDLRASSVDIAKNAGVIGGINQDAMTLLSSEAQANQLFSNLVNTDNVNNGGQFASDGNGNITIIAESTGKGTLDDGGVNIAGTVKNFAKGDMTIKNYAEAKDGLNISGTVVNREGTLNLTNNEGNLVVSGNLQNNGETQIYNLPYNYGASDSKLILSGNIATKGGDLIIDNEGIKGMEISGTVNHKGDAFVTNGFKGMTGNVPNTTGGMLISGEFNTDGNATFTNKAEGIDGMNITGNVHTTGDVVFNNDGAAGLNVYDNGTAIADKNLTMNNTGRDGVNIASSGLVKAENNVFINNDATGGVNVQGYVKANNDVNIKSKDGNVVIGDQTTNDNYVTANNNINIDTTNASILNYGVEKVLLVAGGDLTMNATDGTIGLEVQQGACTGTGCTGVGPKNEGARDFTKSVNANVKGKVKATTTKATKPDDLVINYAAIDSDMNIDTINADGRVILTVDDDYGYNNNGPRYNMVNARPNDNSDTNIEGKGISLIANGSIGTSDNAVTFIQTGAEEGFGMDALANENINLKENSFNDSNYGRNKEITTNKVCTMIAREGDLNVEFGGNTTIENITAEGDMNIVTRGQTMHIKNLGHIKDDSVTPNDYFGPRDYGQRDGGYMGEDYRDEALPNHVTVKALDINHNIRPTEELVDGNHEAWAGSEVRIDNAVLDQGTLDVTADNIYANGIAAHFNKDGFTKEVDPSTNKVIGADQIPTGHAVRPDDVEGVGRDETERNYYYPEGDGDGVFNGEESNVDDNDNIADDTPLEMPDEEPSDTDTDTDNDEEIPADTDTDTDTDDDEEIPADTDTDTDTDDDEEIPADTDTDTDTDDDEEIPADTDTDTDTDDDEEIPADTDTDTDTDDDEEIPADTDTDTDTDDDEEIPADTDTDTDTDDDEEIPADTDTDTDIDNDADTDTDIDTDNDTDTDTDDDVEIPADTDTDTDTDDDEVITSNEDGRALYNRKIDDNSIDSIDKRQYMRFNIKESNLPVAMEKTNNGVDSLIDVSRGGVALNHSGNLKVGDVVPVHLVYGDLDIKADVKIVTATTSRAGAKFINLNPSTANQLLYLSVLLDERTQNITFNK